MDKIQLIANQQKLSPPSIQSKLMVSNSRYQVKQKNKERQMGNERRYLAWQVAPDLLSSFKFAGQGVVYAFKTQRNFRIHSFMTLTAIILGFFLQITNIEMAIISVTCAMVVIFELLNTAIESIVDLTVEQNYHELAKIAKDCAAGAVLISAMASLSVAGFILLPHAIVLIF